MGQSLKKFYIVSLQGKLIVKIIAQKLVEATFKKTSIVHSYYIPIRFIIIAEC